MKILPILAATAVLLCGCSSEANDTTTSVDESTVNETTDETVNDAEDVNTSSDKNSSASDTDEDVGESTDAVVDDADDMNAVEGETTSEELYIAMNIIPDYSKFKPSLDELKAYIADNPITSLEDFKAKANEYFLDLDSEDYAEVLSFASNETIKNTITNVYNFDVDGSLFKEFYNNVEADPEGAIESVLEAKTDVVSPTIFVQCIPYYMYKADISRNKVTVDNLLADIKDIDTSGMIKQLDNWDYSEYNLEFRTYQQLADMQSIPYFDLLYNLGDKYSMGMNDPSDDNIFFSIPIESDIYSSSIGTSKYVIPFNFYGSNGLAAFDENDNLLTIEFPYPGEGYPKNAHFK